MQQNIQMLFKNLLRQKQITKGELLLTARLAGKDALKIKPLKAFTNNIEIFYGNSTQCLNHYFPISSILRHDIYLLQHNMELYDKNKVLFDDIFSNNYPKPIEINAYPVSVLKEDINGNNIPYSQVADDNIQCADEQELSSIFLLFQNYANKFQGKNVQIYSNNVSVVNMLNKYKAKSNKLYLQCPITKIASICMEYKINPYWSTIDHDAVGIASIITDQSYVCHDS